MRLRHFILFQHRLARDADIQARHFRLGFGHELAQPADCVPVQIPGQRMGVHQEDPALGKGDVGLLLGFIPRVEQRRDARRRRGARALQAGRGLGYNPLQRGQGVGQGFRLRVRLAFGRAKLGVDHVKQRNQIRGARELFDERAEVLELFLQAGEVVFRHKQQRLCAHHLQITLVKNIRIQIGFHRFLGTRPNRQENFGGFKFRAQPFHKLPVPFLVLAFHHHHEIVLLGELLLERQKIVLIPLVRADQVVPVHVELEKFDRVEDAEDEQNRLRIQQQPPMPEDQPRKQGQPLGHGGFVGQLFHGLPAAQPARSTNTAVP